MKGSIATKSFTVKNQTLNICRVNNSPTEQASSAFTQTTRIKSSKQKSTNPVWRSAFTTHWQPFQYFSWLV